MHMSLYRTYRPRSFADVIGQDSAVHVIRSALARGQIGHAYLFSGPRGSGKTSLARLLAKAVNCSSLSAAGEPCGLCDSCRAISRGDHLDVIEIDGASNNGVDEVRELRAKVSLAPFSAPRKVYIIDEVHMLSTAAFNALLKTIEEPPEHVIFILATTEPHKVPVTIRSRCQHIPFHRISVPHIRQRLQTVCEAENIPISDEALWELSRQADGALRDALSLLEQAVTLADGELSMESIRQMLGGGTRPEVERWLVLLCDGSPEVHDVLKSMVDAGVSPERLLDQVFLLLRDLWVVCKWGMDAVSGLDLSGQEKTFLAEQAPRWSERDLSAAMDFCLRLFGRVRMGIRGDVFVGVLTSGLLMKPELQRDLPAETGSRAMPPTETANAFLPGKTTAGRTPRPAPPRDAGPPARFSPNVPSVPAASEEGKGEECTGKPAGRPASGSTAGVSVSDDPHRSWTTLLDELKEHDLPLFAALIRCGVELDSAGNLRINFPEREPFLEDLISQERRAWRLARLCEARGIAAPVMLVFGDREIPLGSSEAGSEEPPDTPEGTLFTIPERRSGQAARDGGGELGESGGEGDVPRQETGVEKDVARLRRWFSAEVLLVKQNRAGESPACGDQEEEGAPEQ